MPRDRDVVLRGDLEAPLEREDALFEVLEAALEPADFRVPVDRLAPALEDLPRVGADLVSPLLDRAAAVRDELAREVVPRDFVARVPLDPFVEDLVFADEERDAEDRPELLELPRAEPADAPLEVSLGVHFPDITRCAASATASAMIEPNFVALVTTLLAA